MKIENQINIGDKVMCTSKVSSYSGKSRIVEPISVGYTRVLFEVDQNARLVPMN